MRTTFFRFFYGTLLFLFLISSTAIGQTNVSGGIFNNTTWTKANSPYIVTSNIVVFETATLTIEPGVTVKFLDNTYIELRNAKMHAVGTPNDSIYLTSNSPNPVPGIWHGIKVGTNSIDPQGNQINLGYAKVMYAYELFNMDAAYYTPYNFFNCTFSLNRTVFKNWGPESLVIFIDKCKFDHNDVAIEAGFGYSIRNCIFESNRVGINQATLIDSCYFSNHSDYAVFPWGIMRNCVVINNQVGVNGVHLKGAGFSFDYNTVKNNKIGIYGASTAVGSSFANNIICNNSEWNIYGIGNYSDLRNNCWCTTDSIEIESKIYDAKDNIGFDIAIISPRNCPPSERIVSIKGTVHAGQGYMTLGTVTAINMRTSATYDAQVNSLGEFDISNIPGGTYKLLATSNGGSFHPTYYPNKTNSANAVTINVGGDVYDIDIDLQLTNDIITSYQNNQFEILPNPFQNELEIKNLEEIEIRDATGYLILKGKIIDQKINTTNWSQGIYFVIPQNQRPIKILKL